MVKQYVVDPYPRLAAKNIVAFLKEDGVILTDEQVKAIESTLVSCCVRSRHLQKLADESNMEVWAD
jgi:hypothetical protein